MYYPTFDEFCKKAEGGNLIPVYKEIFADLESPLSAFMKIDKGDYSFLLESVEGREKWARYSFLGSNPKIVIRGEKDGLHLSYYSDNHCVLFSQNYPKNGAGIFVG